MTVRRGVLPILVLVAAFAAVTVTGAGGPRGTAGFTGVATAAMVTAAGIACLRRSAGRHGRLRWAWIGIGLGTLAYAAGEISWTWIETVQGRPVPALSVADAGYLSMAPLTAAGLLLVPAAGQSLAHRIRGVVDGLMIAASLLTIGWIGVLRDVAAEAGGDPLARAVLLAYPVSDIALLTVVLIVAGRARRGGPDRRSFALIGAAIAVIGLADTVWVFVTRHGGYVSGGVLDTGWFLGFALILLAARAPAAPDAADGTGRADTVPPRRPLALLIPYGATVAAVVTSTAAFAVRGADPFVANTRSALIVLIVARQILGLLENRQLTRRLERRVAARTAELTARENRFRALVQRSYDSVALIDPDTTVRYQSDSLERIFGYPVAAVLGRRLADLIGEPAAELIRAAVREVQDRPLASTVIEIPVPHADGRIRQAEMTVTNLLHDPAVGGLVLNTRDVHDAKELQDQLVHEAYHDGLTGLASRALFRERLAGATGDVAILFLDLDGFKEVNDSLGHAAGDRLLVRVAERLRASVRDGDTAARFGGDEFAVLVESGQPAADAEAVAGRILDALAAPIRIGDRELHVGASVGIAVSAGANDAQQLQRNADLAMYQAKAAGGGAYAVYDPAMHDELMARLELAADLRRALDRGELVLHYQPTVRLDSGEIAGFEALVRWNHPERGLVSPLDFIPLAEATGLIVPLGRWVLEEACRQAVAWGGSLKMGVNVSVRQFDRGDLAATVAEVLAATGMPAGRLCLEMTESVLLTDTEENLAQLARVRALGVQLAMDDFGTGYSSLAYLRRFPMDVLKIDRSFVDGLGGGDSDVALVRTIVAMGRDLGMRTIAEGIEDAGQLAVLREMGCDLGQGFHLSRPLPAPAAGRLLRTGLAVPLTAGVV